MDQMVRNDIACNCIQIVRIAFRYAHISFYCFFEDFNCEFTQIRCLSRVLCTFYRNKCPEVVGWLVGFVALRPKSTVMVIAGRSVHLTTLFPGQA